MIGASDAVLRSVHGARVGFVFQDPSSSLNPLLTIEEQLTEGPDVTSVSAGRRPRACAETSAGRAPTDPETRLRSYPHQLSGGSVSA